LQLGADIYCDTALMARVIDGRAPQPPLFPAAIGGLAHLVAQWADSTLFWMAIPYTMQPAGVAHLFAGAPPEFLKAFSADRAAMAAGMRRATTADAAAALRNYFAWLESLLAPGHKFLLGDAPCIADFSVAQSLWYIHRAPPVMGILAPFGVLLEWYRRVTAFGHGPARDELSSEEAIGIAARATGHAATQVEPGSGFEAGAQITVSAIDYAIDPVSGTLVGLDAQAVVIERRDERAGTLHVHFPRIGYQIKQAS
jgi:glutathione S-transferase